MTNLEIKVESLTEACPQDLCRIKNTSEVPPLTGIIGQQRATQAIEFGLNMQGLEYNIFVTGIEGTGKSTIVNKLIREHAKTLSSSQDLCMVNNFEDEYRPQVLQMPQGTAGYLARSMVEFIEALKKRIPEYFQTPEFAKEQEDIQKKFSEPQQALFDAVKKKASELNLGIVRAENGYQVVPVQDGQPMPQETFDALDEKQKKSIGQDAEQVERHLHEVLGRINASNEEKKEAIKALVAAKTQIVIAEQLDPIRYYFREQADIQAWLGRVKADIIEHIVLFLGTQPEPSDQEAGMSRLTGSLTSRYQVNVMVDRRREKGAPVVYEPHPSFVNLFGKIDKKPNMGGFATDFTMVQAGSILKADKGFLILNIEPLLQRPAVWEAFKRTLIDSQLRIEDAPEQTDYGMPSLKPEPIPIQVKVILIGGYEPFRALQSMDSNFNKIFKVRADFDYEAERNPENIWHYARFVSDVCYRENLLPFLPEAVWQVVEYGSRLVDDRRKLSLQFGKIRALLMEADYWAKKENLDCVTKLHVFKAQAQHRRRHNLYEEKVMAEFDDDSVLLDVQGETVGQVNALAVYDMGEIAFGRPTRITAESYMGNPGIINVERESDLSGQTHDKGMMIIAGYLGKMFAQRYPLSVSISITFEQSYDGVDGDSASSTELYAVLSSLSGIPIRQDIAVTGSVNQKGEIQAIGGVNEKIEGFLDICLRKGLSGTQGVMIPDSNVKNLVLGPQVLDAIQQGRFHLYSVKTIEQGIEVLTGVPAGKIRKDLTFPKRSVFGRVQQKLLQYHQLSSQFCQ